MNSCLYEGTIRHRRHTPLRHAFSYRLYMAYLDLAELEDAFAGSLLWSTRRRAAARFRREDHFGDVAVPLDQCVRDLVEARLGWRPTGAICLLTNLRHFGFLMNPVSFYYCFAADGRSLDAVVAEVNNTPWNERHLYAIDLRSQRGARKLVATNPKEFHVSPFLQMELDYHWRFSLPSERLVMHIDAAGARGKPFDATLVLRRAELSRSNRARVLLRFPLMTMQIFAGIYWQALRLWWKGVKYVPHPGGVASTATAP